MMTPRLNHSCAFEMHTNHDDEINRTTVSLFPYTLLADTAVYAPGPASLRLELQEVSDQSREHHFGSFNELVNFLSAEILIMPYDDPELPAEND